MAAGAGDTLAALTSVERHPATRATLRNPLPEGTVSVGAGLVISGLASYAYLSLSRRMLGEDAFAPLSVLWFSTFVLAPGFFLPVEQEVGRALAHRRALLQGGRPLVRRAAVLAGVLMIAISVAILALAPFLTDQLFSGYWGLVIALLVAFVGYAAAHFVRGLFSGTGRFGGYGTFMGTDGLVRVGATVALAVAGVSAVVPYGLLVGIPPLIAVIVALWVAHPAEALHDGPEASWRELTPNLGWLLGGSVLAAALVNAGPLAASLLALPSEQALVSAFNAGVLVARVPLFLFQAVQAALLPKLARLAAMGMVLEFRRGFRRLLSSVVLVGALGTLGAFVFGPFALEVLFDSELSRRTLTLLALASAIYMVALTLAQAIIALRGHSLVAVGWLAGMVAFLVGLAAGGNDLLLRVEVAMIAGSVAALVVFAFALRSRLAAGIQPDEESLVEAFHDRPIEP
jgi:O-antigen/teichoic acid export membrane protein